MLFDLSGLIGFLMAIAELLPPEQMETINMIIEVLSGGGFPGLR